MDKLKAFESFVSVATRGSLTAAAKAEGVAPAIMGRRLDALEEHLGVKLLVRTTRRISLTHEGSAFLEDCQRLLSDVANAEASVSEGGVKATGHLRITAPAGFGRRHVAPLVPRFRSAHPDVTISLNLSDRVVDLAGEGFDCAVRVGDLPDSSLVSVRIADNRRLCVATPKYLARRGTPRAPAELVQHDCLTLSSDASQTRGWAFRVPLADGATEVMHLKPGGPLDCSDGQVAIVDTQGNRDCPVILRGGKAPNYDAASVAAACQDLAAAQLPATLMVDCSHANSSKQHQKQLDVARDIAAQIAGGSRSVFGLMIESHLNAGAQKFSPGKDLPSALEYGKSITDACLGWDDSLQSLAELSAAVVARRAL